MDAKKSQILPQCLDVKQVWLILGLGVYVQMLLSTSFSSYKIYITALFTVIRLNVVKHGKFNVTKDQVVMKVNTVPCWCVNTMYFFLCLLK